jgi:hypothetical protein
MPASESPRCKQCGGKIEIERHLWLEKTGKVETFVRFPFAAARASRPPMGDEAFDEVIIAARRGTLFIRGGYGREELWLGRLARAARRGVDPSPCTVIVGVVALQCPFCIARAALGKP